MDKFDFIDREFQRRQAANQVRRLRRVIPRDNGRIELNGRTLINVSSNDYLGLSRHPLLAERAAAYLEKYGAGATASRLICGNYACVEETEEKLAALKQTPAALIFNAGYQANATLLPALCDRKSLILSDRLNHNSIIAGCHLSRCAVKPFVHNDMDDLERLLAENAASGFSRIVIVTETVFSMDGDTGDIDRLSSLAKRFGAILMVDEAHATGVFGDNGMGLACGAGADLVMGTFGKGCGSFGAYVACSRKMREYLINCCPGFVYSTGLPPAVIGAIDAALDLIPGMAEERRRLLDNAAFLRKRLNGLGLSTGASATQIIPVIMGAENKALSLSAWLEELGFLAVAIRPPSVPADQSRLRISLSAALDRRDVEALAGAIEQWTAK
ncbi:MAG: 8-amino-7-oxononanoate synthase [Thermodesulfobacteriota bacterium]